MPSFIILDASTLSLEDPVGSAYVCNYKVDPVFQLLIDVSVTHTVKTILQLYILTDISLLWTQLFYLNCPEVLMYSI